MKGKTKSGATYEILAGIGFILLVVAVTLSIHNTEKIKRDYECYISHVQECLDCHSQNLTYLLCSGFCVPPLPSDADAENYSMTKHCVWGINRNCFDLDSECNLP